VKEDRRKLRNEELNNLYCSEKLIRVLKSGGRNGMKLGAGGKYAECINIFSKEPEGKRPLTVRYRRLV
jgi:hypothetical protein